MMPDHLLSDNKKLAALQLGQHLRDGTLVLIIGAGASRGVGLPLWWELVKRCLEEAGLSDLALQVDKNSSNELLRKSMEKVATKFDKIEAYKAVVHSALYKDVLYTEEVIRERLLIAFGALLMGSKRGRVKIVISFNFDNVLEWYLGLHGFETQVVSKLPCLLRETDVTIYHPHGFLPKEPSSGGMESDFVILSQYSYDERLGDEKDPWIRFTKGILSEKVGLFVGLSGDDPIFGPILVDVKKGIGLDRITGFWLFGPGEADMSDFERRNIVPLRFETYEEIPSFLLSVCQHAAQ